MEETLIFSKAELVPDRAKAGDSTEFIIRIVIGTGYTSRPSRLVFDFPATLGMSRPSLFHREESGFVEVYVSNPNVTWEKRIWDVETGDFANRIETAWRGMAQRMLVLDLSGGLAAGDTLELHWGDTSGGFGAGARVTTIVPVPNYEALIHVRYFESQAKGLPDFGRPFKGHTRPMPDCQIALRLRVESRGLHHLRLIRQVSSAVLIPHDVFWNVAVVERVEDVGDVDDSPTRNAFGVFEFANKNVQVRSKGKPLADAPTMDNVVDGFNIYWGDVHTHSAFSKDCIEREKLQMLPADLMRFARDRARLDFFAVTDHHQLGDKERNKISESNWEQTLEAIRQHDCAGRFLTFAGFELQCPRGDTTILCNWLPQYAEIDHPEWSDLRDMWKAWLGKDYLSMAHFHNPGSLAPDEWREHPDANIAPVLEIFSCHGSFERQDTWENRPALCQQTRRDRFGAYFLARGFRYGFACNSDGHKGHVGTSGLTAAFAPALDKDSILAAYRNRRVYGTTNARIRLIFMANGRLMGSILKNATTKSFSISIRGENCLKRIDLFRNTELYQRFYPAGIEFQHEFTIHEDEPSDWYVRATQVDNHQAYSSPIWFCE